MAWSKDAASRSPKTVYTAPEDQWPLVAIVFDPDAAHKWSVEYAYFSDETETQGSVEALMGL